MNLRERTEKDLEVAITYTRVRIANLRKSIPDRAVGVTGIFEDLLAELEAELNARRNPEPVSMTTPQQPAGTSKAEPVSTDHSELEPPPRRRRKREPVLANHSGGDKILNTGGP